VAAASFPLPPVFLPAPPLLEAVAFELPDLLQVFFGDSPAWFPDLFYIQPRGAICISVEQSNAWQEQYTKVLQHSTQRIVWTCAKQRGSVSQMRKPELTLSSSELTSSSNNDIGRTAIFFDYENIVLGVKGTFEPSRIMEYLGSRGNVLIRRAYADWGHFKTDQSKLLELGVEMVFLPTYGVKDKNRTDTAIAVDAMEILALHPNIDTFVIVSGDSDFGVLARKLRGYGKQIIGISSKKSASKVLVSVCHEFVFYETLVGEKLRGYSTKEGHRFLKKVLPRLVEDYGNTFQPSLIKDRLRKLDSSFSERNFGFGSFNKFLECYPELLTVQSYPGGKNEVTIKESADS
jgi:uncharacterized protein (TIGR00288 family)